MTEVLPVADISLSRAARPRAAATGVCVGRPVRGVTVGGEPARRPTAPARATRSPTAGVTGEVCVRAAHVKDRYDRLWATERASARTPGWHRTGDVGHLDDDGPALGGGPAGARGHHVRTARSPRSASSSGSRPSPRSRRPPCVGVGPAGTQQVVVVVVPSADAHRVPALAPGRPGRVPCARRPRSRSLRCSSPASLPVDIRHASKVDRAAVGPLGRPGAGRRTGRAPVRVLVTGASGMLGAGVARALHARGDDVTVLQRRPSGLRPARGPRRRRRPRPPSPGPRGGRTPSCTWPPRST